MGKRGYPKGRPRKYPKTKPSDFSVTPKSEPEIDLAAALSRQAPAPPPQPPSINKDILVNNNIKTREVNNIKVIDDSKIDTDFNIKGQLTGKEIRFIELYLSGEYTQINAMKLAGYANYHDNSLNRLARKIVQKYESWAGDQRKTLRGMGYGEVRVLQLLIEAATGFKSETVKLNARIALAKCLGLQKEVLEGGEGITIVIRAGEPEGIKAKLPAQSTPAALLPGPGVRMIK